MEEQISTKNKKLIQLLIVFTGVSSIITQLVSIRECYAQFHGNVYVIAMIFFVWLIAGSIGTLLASQCPQKVLTFKSLGFLSIALAIFPGMQLLIIRFLMQIIFIEGAEIGFYNTFSFVACTLSIYPLLIGLALPFTYFVFRSSCEALKTEKVYIYDNIGDALGGLIFSFFLVQTCSPIMGTSLMNLPLLITGIYLLIQNIHSKYINCSLTLISLSLFIIPFLLEHISLNLNHKKMVHYEESCYSRIQVFQDGTRYILTKDGIPQSNERNISFEESMVHFGLSQVKTIHRVLTISANKGILLEIQKYQPEWIENIEIDPVKGKVEHQFGFLPHFENLLSIYTDGRKYLQETSNDYDAVILNLPEPDTFQVNRFYTQTFFKTVQSKMNSDGVVVFSIDGFDSYLSETRNKQISSLYQTALSVFPHVKLYPGERIYFVCGNMPLQMDIPELLSQKKIQTRYVQYYYYGDISQQRIEYLQAHLIPSVSINYDNIPILVRLTVENWLSAFHSDFQFFIMGILALFCLCSFMTTTTEFVLFSSGMTLMGFEILLIFLFQMRMGDVYYQVCWIVTCFLLGLIPGAYFSSFWIRTRNISRMLLFKLDLFIMVMIISFLLGLVWLPYSVSFMLFLGFGLILSMLCGFQFPLVLHMHETSTKAITRFFAADILGAAFGIVLVSILGIPYFGLAWTAFGLGIVKLLSCIRFLQPIKF